MEYNAAIASQPANLEVSRRAVTDCLAKTDLSPWQHGTIAVASIGASSHAGHIFASQMTAAGRRVVLLDAAELAGYRPGVDVADSFVFVTEGGRSRETIAAAEAAAGRPRMALTNVPRAPIADAVDTVIGLGHGSDSRVYTVGYTATVQAFGLLTEALTDGSAAEPWTELPSVVQMVLDEVAPRMPEVAKVLSGLTNIDVVGSRASLSAVHEAALMLREGPRITGTSYETHQYLHGPMESQTTDSGCILFGGDREIRLARYAAQRGINTVLITTAEVAEQDRLTVLRIPQLPPSSAAIAQILPIQLLVGQLTRLRGIDIDEFRYDQDDTKVGPPLAGEGH